MMIQTPRDDDDDDDDSDSDVHSDSDDDIDVDDNNDDDHDDHDDLCCYRCLDDCRSTNQDSYTHAMLYSVHNCMSSLSKLTFLLLRQL